MPPVSLLREMVLTRIGIAATLMAAVLFALGALENLSAHVAARTWTTIVTAGGFLLIVAPLILGGLVYQLARLGHLQRLRTHRPAAEEDLFELYRRANVPDVTVLVPAYKEEVDVVRKTLLSAALQDYPRRQVVLLIDDPPTPTRAGDAIRLAAVRSLPQEISDLLRGPRARYRAALDAFRERQAHGPLVMDAERQHLADLAGEVADWFRAQARRHRNHDHVDELFVHLTYEQPARRWERWRNGLTGSTTWPRRGAEEVEAAFRRFGDLFDVAVTSFERKRYDNLAHEPNKAMNLNSYLACMGRGFRIAPAASGRLVLEDAAPAQATLYVPDADYVLMLDADSLLDAEYTVRLVHVMEQPGHERVAVVQTPYSAVPGAPGVLERVAGATTDIQYIAHQGFTRYDATFWVGANALVRKRALVDIAVDDVERGHPVRKFIRDRTVIEDTESTVDLVEHGWRLHNYPERLAYSATPPDFGALLIQRRRWANGGLLILARLLRYLRRRPLDRAWIAEALMRCHYLTSLATANVGLLVLLAVPLGEGVANVWLPLTAVPYYALYMRDLRQSGYRRGDLLRVYALNLLLIPVHLAGVLNSLQQRLSGRKSRFGRTPKVQGGTHAPRRYIAAEYGVLCQWLLGGIVEATRGHHLHAGFALVNALFLAYAIRTFIGAPDVNWGGVVSLVRALVPGRAATVGVGGTRIAMD